MKTLFHRKIRLAAPLILSTAFIVNIGAVHAAALEEIVVTATKRSQSLQDVPLSITALSSKDLEVAGTEELLDFAVKIPNLAVSYEADGRFDSSSPALRGIFGENTTGVYFDETRVNASLLPRVVNLERIEVLRGPQGSLYGARSMGGTIRYITKRPDLNESSGSVNVKLASVTDGDLNQNVDAFFNVPVIQDQFAIGVSAYYGSNSGVQDRVHQPGRNTPAFARNEDVDDEDYYGGSIVGNIKISDTLSFIPKIVAQKIDSDGLPFADNDPESVTQVRFFDSEEPGTDEWVVASGTFEWEVANGTVTSTTSYYNRETDESEEEHTFLDFLYNNVIGIPVDPFESVLSTTSDYESFIQETRYSSDFDGPLQFTAGFYYEDLEHVLTYPPALQPGINAALNAVVGGPANIVPGDLIFSTFNVEQTEEVAVFGELTYEINDQLTLTVGGRYYDTSVDQRIDSDGFANGGPSSVDDSQSENGFNPKFALGYAYSEDTNLYATVARGFRIGGVNGNVPASLCGAELAGLGLDPSNATTFDSDELTSYELGVKTSLANDSVTVNAAAFFIDWEDIQQLNRLACGFQFVDNAGQAESKGFELEVTAAPSENLLLAFGAGYTNAEITETGNVAGVTVGDKIQGVPDWTLNASLEYDFDFNATWAGLFRADANYYGDSFSSNNESSAQTQRLRESWSTANLRLSAISDKYEFTLFIKNLADERANLADSRSIAAETPGRQRLVTSRPRTIGIEARLRF